jgi:hypothetical protein
MSRWPVLTSCSREPMASRKDRIDAPNLYHLELARKWLVFFYRATGRPIKAAEWSKTKVPQKLS